MGAIFSKISRRNRNEKPPLPPKPRRGSLPRDTDDLSSIPLQQLAVQTASRPIRVRFRTREEILAMRGAVAGRVKLDSWKRKSHPPSYLNVDHRTQSRTVSYQNRSYGYVERLEDEDTGIQGNVRRLQSHPSTMESPTNKDTITVVVEAPTPESSDQEGYEALRPAKVRKYRRSLRAGLVLEPGTYRFKVHKRIVVQQKD